MRLISKGVEPNALAEHRLAGGTYDDFSQEKGKGVVQVQLLVEQGSCCAYCTRSIAKENMKLEHWWPQNRPPDRSLDYTNMLACCDGTTYGGAFRHCDTSKAGKPITFDPQRPEHVETVHYGKASGEIGSSDDTLHEDLTKSDRLNLNCSPIKGERSKRIKGLRQELAIKNKKGKAVNFTKLLNQYENKRTPYDDIIILYLRKKATVQ